MSNTTPAATPNRTHSRFVRWGNTEWLRLLLLLLTGFVARLPALQGEPIWDDDFLVRTNPLIKSPLLILETFQHYLFPDAFSAHYRPVQNLSYLFDYLLWNNNFYGFHLTSVLCHVVSGILLYALLKKLLLQLRTGAPTVDPRDNSTVKDLPAFFIALLWLVHPVHSAAVDYVSGRADSLAFLFACTAWLLFLNARSLTHRGLSLSLSVASWASGVLALCSRESGVIWMGLFWLYLLSFDRGSRPSKCWASIGCVTIGLVYCALRALPGPASLPDTSSDILPPLLRIALMFRSLGDYTCLMFFPHNLHMERTVYDPKAYQSETGRWHVLEHEYLSVIGLLVLVAFVLLCIRGGPGKRIRIFGAIWFFAAYLPVSNLISLNATVAEHWLYLPSVGFLIFVVGCVVDLPHRLHPWLAIVGCVAALALTGSSFYRSSDWTSIETFSHRTIARGGGTIRVVLLLGGVYAGRGDYPAAERLLRRALQLSPNHPLARNNLADALAHQGKNKEAEALFVRSAQTAMTDRREYSRTWVAALNLSQLRYKQHDHAGAIAVLEEARKQYPDNWELISAESEILREDNDIDRAVPLIRDFVEKNWWHYRAWGGYGRLLAQKGDVDAATNALQHASWLDVHETAALNLLALMQLRENHFEDARRTQQRAVARQPDEPRQYVLLSNILEKMGRNDEAHAVLAEVSRLRDVAGIKTAQN